MRRLAKAALAATVLAASVPCLEALGGDAPRFVSARAAWPEGRELVMNDSAEFRATFECSPDARPVLRVTACSFYRVRLNGKFAGYGPARAAKGWFRVDEWPLDVRSGKNEVSIEVSAYNCNTFYVPDQPAFLAAEIVAGGRTLAATLPEDASVAAFRAFATPRVPNVTRYSYQRGFNEAYSLSPGRTFPELPLAVRPMPKLLERIAPYPAFASVALSPVSATKVEYAEPAKFRTARWVDATAPWMKCYGVSDLAVNFWRELQCVKVSPDGDSEAPAPGGGWRVAPGRGVQFDCGLDASGFAAMKVRCSAKGRLWLAVDELLCGGVVNPLRYTVCNAVAYDMEPGEYEIETFEPYTFRYLHAYSFDGGFDISSPSVRTYRSPAADGVRWRSSDPEVDKVFAAARETFAQNAVDVFTDCPSRERAGWLCDSFFMGRAAALLTGSTDLERLFIQNYTLPERFDDIPDGMLPMCYPSDHRSGRYIPNWAMWFAIEAAEYLERSGDRETVDALRPRLESLVAFLWKYRNSDGLLEKLPGWVFLEWSEANSLVQDVNYPSNATWAETLDAMDRMYGRPDLAAEARRVRETVRRQSWTGEWFCDNAVRGKDGALALSGKCSETCQYYMFTFGVASPESHSALWKTLLEDFGPDRRETKKHPQIFFANAFIGNFLRLELLSRHGLDRRLIEETKGYFGYMAERTGTLWEYVSDWKSCNHGFASYAAALYARSLLGIDRVLPGGRTAFLREPDSPLGFCEGSFPVQGGGEITVSVRDGRQTVSIPSPDFRVLPAAVGDKSPAGAPKESAE